MISLLKQPVVRELVYCVPYKGAFEGVWKIKALKGLLDDSNAISNSSSNLSGWRSVLLVEIIPA